MRWAWATFVVAASVTGVLLGYFAAVPAIAPAVAVVVAAGGPVVETPCVVDAVVVKCPGVDAGQGMAMDRRDSRVGMDTLVAVRTVLPCRENTLDTLRTVVEGMDTVGRRLVRPGPVTRTTVEVVASIQVMNQSRGA